MRTRSAYAVAMACTMLFCGGTGNAASIHIDNFSFEEPSLSLGQSQVGTVPGWVASPGAGVLNIGSSAPDGTQVAFGNPAGVTQELAATLQPNTLYTLKVDVGDSSNDGLSGYRIIFNAGGSAVAIDNASLLPQSGFLTSTLTYIAPANSPFLGQALSIVLEMGPVGEMFDNVRLTTAPIPEPETYALMLFGLALVTTIVRRKQRSKLPV